MEEGRPIPSMSEILSSTKINLIERLADFEDRFTEIVQENAHLNLRISDLEARQQALEASFNPPTDQTREATTTDSWFSKFIRTILGGR